MHQLIIALKTDLTTDHDAGAGTAGPAAADLALDKRVAVFVADGDAAAAAEALVVGIERTRNPGRRGARVGVGEAKGLPLHWISRGCGVQMGGYEINVENISILFFCVCVL